MSPNTLINFPTFVRPILTYVYIAEWLGGLAIKRGLLISNSDAVAISTNRSNSRYGETISVDCAAESNRQVSFI